MTLVSHNIVEGFWPCPRTSQHANWRSADLPSSGWPTLPPETDDKIFYNYKLQFWETLNMIFSLTIKKNLQSHLVHQLVIRECCLPQCFTTSCRLLAWKEVCLSVVSGFNMMTQLSVSPELVTFYQRNCQRWPPRCWWQNLKLYLFVQDCK